MSGESAANVDDNVDARSDGAAVAIVDKAKNGICGEISSRRDKNVCVTGGMATVVIQDLEVSVALRSEITRYIKINEGVSANVAAIAIVDRGFKRIAGSTKSAANVETYVGG